MSVIKRANELVEDYGKEYAIKHFQDKITAMGEPKNFEELCRKSGWEIAIEHIKKLKTLK